MSKPKKPKKPIKRPYLIDFREPETAEDLARYLGVEPDLFKQVISSDTRREFYVRHLIQKRSRHRRTKAREVWEAEVFPLSAAHKATARRVEIFCRAVESRFPHRAAYGYVRHRGTRDNAAAHCGARLLLRADLKDFFPSITIDRLITRFSKLGMKLPVSRALAKFVTIDDRLPLGLNASPMLANLICIELDEKLETLAEENNCKYTRYADDIAISGNEQLPKKEKIEDIIKSEGFMLAQDKFRVTKIGQAHYVTGLSISDAESPHAPRHMKKRLRQELYYSKKFGLHDHRRRIGTQEGADKIINRLDGTVRYVGYHEKNLAKKMRLLWNDILEKEQGGPSYETLDSDIARSVTCFIDESEIKFHNKHYLALGLVFTDDVQALETSTAATLRDHEIGDPFYAGDKTALKKKGLHFVDSHPDLRTAYVKALSGLPYRAFIIYRELTSDDDYEKTYISLLMKILPHRLMFYDGVSLRILVEENSKIKITALQQAINGVYKSLEKTNNRRPAENPGVSFGKKIDHLGFSAPDYLLGIFGRFAQLNENKEEMVRRHQFERLRDKYRLIVDADTGKQFSRRVPFEPWEISET